MHAPQSLLQAALNRLGARLGSGFADSAASLAVLAQEAPERLRRELELFWSEVEQEAQRLETEASRGGTGTEAGGGDATATAAAWAAAPPQDQIDDLRARVAALSRQLEDQA
ncbi:hypothetical protein VB734_13755 [Synechococcus sp. BA-124 BA4]|uniref:hypothetical protein n=1 Tax=unclassified Synechococcus TaxID=2626047 RepID=UPI0018CD3639|nr:MULTISPECIES: hypothetical protein [unclassified Synechococcus]MEA5401102.1 hypothetical protein [Synechococcus sp. BA-124 BA4]QPN55535.1 hypothetical protein I1E95_09955 [Synechococcus sp. CBW1107]CAK6690276.1 hypothetical protein BBFGKLBO_00786 [Synechococcus sp. CBW1107]